MTKEVYEVVAYDQADSAASPEVVFVIVVAQSVEQAIAIAYRKNAVALSALEDPIVSARPFRQT